MPRVNKLDRIREQIAVDVPVGEAIRFAIGGSIPNWAKRHHIHRTEASLTINSKRLPPSQRVLTALASDLGATEAEIRELLAQGAQAVALAS